MSTIVTSLCKNIFSEKEELRDICGIGKYTDPHLPDDSLMRVQ